MNTLIVVSSFPKSLLFNVIIIRISLYNTLRYIPFTLSNNIKHIFNRIIMLFSNFLNKYFVNLKIFKNFPLHFYIN